MNSVEVVTNSLKESLEELSRPRDDKRPVVAAYGLMNAGKSFLLNMLTKNIEHEFFKVNDIRETSEIKTFESERYVYLDTPGLDANQKDDIKSKSWVSKADIILFIHQPQGELDANEVEFLKGLRSSFGSYAETNIILVLSKIEKETQEKISTIANMIKFQCAQEIGFSPELFQVSNKRYQAGVMQHKSGLVLGSHINMLIEHIDAIAINVEQVRLKRTATSIESIARLLIGRERHLKYSKKEAEDKIKSGFLLFNEQINNLREFLDESASKYLII